MSGWQASEVTEARTPWVRRGSMMSVTRNDRFGHETDGAISEHQSINAPSERQPMVYAYFVWWQVAVST
jgi:hypothetical protein